MVAKTRVSNRITKTLFLIGLTVGTLTLMESPIHASCELDWNQDGIVDQLDFIDGENVEGFYSEWYVHTSYPSLYSTYFPERDPMALDWVVDGKVDEDDLIGSYDPDAETEGFYSSWYVYMYYPQYFDLLFPESECGNTYAPSSMTAVWANTGEDKIVQTDLRATQNATAVHNSVWNGNTISLFAARNEMVAFNLILEAGQDSVPAVEVEFDLLSGPSGSTISSVAPANAQGVFDWSERDIELFYVRYQQIRGLSKLSYETYDERHIPERMRRPYSGQGAGSGDWTSRPDHDAYYPEIAVPLELENSFAIDAGKNQSIWTDIYVPKDVAPGIYTGDILIKESAQLTRKIPVRLQVRNFELPDTPTLKTMIALGYSDINNRYLGQPYLYEPAMEEQSRKVRDIHFQMAHRHKLSLIGDAESTWSGEDNPSPEWLSRLDGSLFTPNNGYAGPGEGTGNNVYSIHTYSCPWMSEGEAAMQGHADAWVNWFETNFPETEHFVYLLDEPTSESYDDIDNWARWVENSPGPGRDLMTLSTLNLPESQEHIPHLDISPSWSSSVFGVAEEWQNAVDEQLAQEDKRFWLYNGKRPSAGSFATEDDGVALRVLAWAQYKKKVQRWFFWESTYYNNFQGGTGETNVFESAFAFGSKSGVDSITGETGWNYSNGDGVLFYPGTDRVFPQVSYGVMGPIASLRLKHWRRGIQDGDYLAMAEAIDPVAVQGIIASQVPKVLWELGVDDINDPTWVLSDISWSTDPDDWESVRARLADIIEGQ